MRGGSLDRASQAEHAVDQRIGAEEDYQHIQSDSRPHESQRAEQNRKDSADDERPPVANDYMRHIRDSRTKAAIRSRTSPTLRQPCTRPAMTATESAPAPRQAAAFSSVMPPIATRGFGVIARASASPSRPTVASGRSFDSVANTGPNATWSTGSASAARIWCAWCV